MTGTKKAASARVAGKHGFSLIRDEKFRELYSLLLACRILNQRASRNCAHEQWDGCEAVTAAVVACLQTGDTIPATPRGLAAHYLLTHSLVCESAAISDATAHLAAATGDALRHKLEKRGNIAVAFAAADETESMRTIFATAMQQSLPVLYVLDDDVRVEEACGAIPVMRLDAADTVAAYRVAYESITRAREGGGPTIIQCVAWRGDKAQDAVVRLEQYLAGKKLFRSDWKQRLEAKHCAALDRAAQAAGLRLR